ncbi:MAG: TetR/AcrR family transcriptional regulator [Desulfarculus sp.]|nr:TetR/AcrR family transcriptional regulator [Desulfarculus sp.]
MGIAERKTRERQQRALQIMDAAKRVFSAKGFGGATMEEIAQAAELSPATLYLYFKNKNELYASLNLRMLTFLRERLDKVAQDASLDSGQKVRALSGALYDVFQFDPLILFNVFHMQSSEALGALSPPMVEKINGLSAQALRAMGAIFQQGMDQGVFRPGHPIALADMVWAVFSGLVLFEENKRIFDPGKDFLKPTLDMALEIIARGLEAPAPPPVPAAPARAKARPARGQKVKTP